MAEKYEITHEEIYKIVYDSLTSLNRSLVALHEKNQSLFGRMDEKEKKGLVNKVGK